MAKTFLSGLELSNFRGIGSYSQKIAQFSDINFFIGANNSGKSAILNFIAKYLHPVKGERHAWRRLFEDLDRNAVRGQGAVRWRIAVRTPRAPINLDDNPHIRPLLERLLKEISEDGLIWLEPTENGDHLVVSSYIMQKVPSCLDNGEWNRLWGAITRRSGGGLHEHWIPETMSRVSASLEPNFPQVSFIPAIREIGPTGRPFENFSGEGLIDKLAEIQNPPHDRRSDRNKFDKINAFLRAATDSGDAQIEVPYDRRHLLVHMDDRVLPLSSLGTGIHEVIMLAAFCTLVEEQIVCVEEPEIHLHPLLQRKLMRYLRDNTSNQYFIATHSASLIDSVRASIFGVSKDVSADTTIRLVAEASERHQICSQLGYKASDLLQTNAIIWVEGPSDRIYLNHWIRAANQKLVEGVDYSIMFYGGRLLSHLSANDPDVDEFISLRRLNRNIFVLIDSDKKSSFSKINDTKQRVAKEFGDSYCWITAGREIENYVPPGLIKDALSRIYPKFERLEDDGRFGHRLNFFEQDGKAVRKADKLSVANFVIGAPADFSSLDVKKRVGQLVSFIESANL